MSKKEKEKEKKGKMPVMTRKKKDACNGSTFLWSRT